MNIGSICSRRIVTVDSKANLAQAASQMRERHVGALIVTAASAEGARVIRSGLEREALESVPLPTVPMLRIPVSSSSWGTALA